MKIFIEVSSWPYNGTHLNTYGYIIVNDYLADTL
jgi:hypothetical protein